MALGFKEVSCPAYGWHEIINSNDFDLCQAVTIELLFGGAHCWETTAQRQASTRVSSHVWVHGERCIDPPLENATAIGTQNQRQRIKGNVRVPLRYLIRWTNFPQSSLSGARTLAVKNAMEVQVSGLALLVAYKVLATRL